MPSKCAATPTGPNQEQIGNGRIYEFAQMRPTSEMVRQHALRWLGYLGRMAGPRRIGTGRAISRGLLDA
jgi:hypothetical protein